MLSHSVEDAGPERDDSADEDERNGRCEQATSPDADRSAISTSVFGLEFLYTKRHFSPLKTGRPPFVC